MNKIQKSDLDKIEINELDKAFYSVKFKEKKPENIPENKQKRDVIYFIKKYAHKYKIDTHNILNLKWFINEIENETQDFYELWIISELKKIMSRLSENEFERLYSYILDLSQRQKTNIIENYIRALDNSAIVQIIDKKWIIKYVNNMYKKVSWDHRVVVWKKASSMWGKLFHDDDFWKEMWETILRGEIWTWVIQNPKIDNKNDSYYTYTTITPIKNEFWDVIEFITIKFDITKSKKYQKELAVLNEELTEIINSTSQWFWVIDKDLNLLEVNVSLCKMLGYPKSEMVNRNIREFLDERNQTILDEQVKDIETTLDRKYHIDFKRKNWKLLPVILKATSLYDNHWNFKKAIAFITDITEIREDQKRLYNVAMKDELTWIWNKRHFNQNFDNYFNRILNWNSEIINMSICLLDIDFFKTVNDTLWHDVWDAVLKEFWKRLLHISKTNIEVYRIGWEEFWVIWYNISPEKFESIMEEFRIYNEQNPVIYSTWEVSFTISWWISHFKAKMFKDINAPRDLFKKTDKLLYKAKDKWRNNLVVDK